MPLHCQEKWKIISGMPQEAVFLLKMGFLQGMGFLLKNSFVHKNSFAHKNGFVHKTWRTQAAQGKRTKDGKRILMQDLLTVTGLILKAEPIGEYDRRIVLLTRERGKIPAFARGARRQNSRLMGPTSPLSFGEFKLYAGRSSYTVGEAFISNYFETLRSDYEGSCYGMYFLEICDYCTRENNDEREQLKLLYQSLRALGAAGIPRPLVRYIFELRTIVTGGEFPGIPTYRQWQESTRYAVSFIASAPVEKLYTFTVSSQVLAELGEIAGLLVRRFLDGNFKSLEILELLVEKP